jgi:hypothetical protein
LHLCLVSGEQTNFAACQVARFPLGKLPRSHLTQRAATLQRSFLDKA